jgi:hypothetical protein
MAKMTLRQYANKWLKDKGTTAKEAKKDAGKYKSIAAAKKAGSLYYTNKDGKTMLAVYAEDLKSPGRTSSPRPKLRPTKKAAPKTTPNNKSGEMPKRKKASVQDISLTATAAIDGKSGVDKYIKKLQAEIKELKAEAAAAKKRGVVPRRIQNEIRVREGAIKRIKDKRK